MKDQIDSNGKSGKTWIQRKGFVRAIRATEVQVGDTLIFNNGYTGRVLEVERETKCYRFFTVEEGGEVYKGHKIHKNYMVAVGNEAYQRVAQG